MSLRVTIITEDDVLDYLDGRLDRETATAVSQAIATDPELRACAAAASQARRDLSLLLTA